MPGRLVILEMDAKRGFHSYMDGLLGLEVAKPVTPTDGVARCHYIVLTPASKAKLSAWSKGNKLPVPHGRTFYLYCALGYPDTPELLAYDEIDQQEDKPKRTRKTVKKKTKA